MFSQAIFRNSCSPVFIINQQASSFNMSKGKIIILSGPSGSGKTTIHDRLLKSAAMSNRLVRSVSTTTRDPRRGEQNGRDYFFVSRRMFEYKIRAGHFLEWAKVFTDYYGTPARPVRDLLKTGKSVLLCIDVQGARQVMAKAPEAVGIFIQAPSMAELKSRLVHRGTETPEAVAVRLTAAQKEMRQAAQYDYVVVNDDLSRALRQVRTILGGVLV